MCVGRQAMFGLLGGAKNPLKAGAMGLAGIAADKIFSKKKKPEPQSSASGPMATSSIAPVAFGG